MIDRLFRERTSTRVAAIEETCAEIRQHLGEWRDRLGEQLREQLAGLEAGCPPSFIRVAGQSHLEKPFNRLLAWMVDPHGDHGWSNAFLKLLAERMGLPEMVEDLDAGELPGIRAEQALDGDDSGKEPDLVIWTTRAALLLENKVWAPESGDQYGPYLASFRTLAGPRTTKAFLSARESRDTPLHWDGFLLHSDLANLLFHIGTGANESPVWARVCAVMCAVALEDRRDAETLREARVLLRKTEEEPVSVDQISRLRKLLPLPTPRTPWADAPDVGHSPLL
jgi:hypothetical protein